MKLPFSQFLVFLLIFSAFILSPVNAQTSKQIDETPIPLTENKSLNDASIVDAEPAAAVGKEGEPDVISVENDTIVDEKPKTAAEIIAEVNAAAEKYASPAIDIIEEVSETSNASDSIQTMEVEESSENDDPNLPLPDEIASGDIVIEGIEDDLKNEVTATTTETLFEKADALEPLLMLKGTPQDDVNEVESMKKIYGKIVPEKKPLGRRKSLFRWVLKSADGKRIPLKSNIKLLQEVKRENLLDGYVALTGKFSESGFNKDLRYFIVDSAVIIDELPVENNVKETIATNTEIITPATYSTEISSGTILLEKEQSSKDIKDPETKLNEKSE